MSYMGFKKLKETIEKKGGAKDAGAVAASVMRKKYKKSDIIKHLKSKTSMKNVAPKKVYG